MCFAMLSRRPTSGASWHLQYPRMFERRWKKTGKGATTSYCCNYIVVAENFRHGENKLHFLKYSADKLNRNIQYCT